MFKETFEEYSASKDSRNRYNAPVHNAAAVLASEYWNTLRRFENIGRGASIGIMATIQGGLPDSLQIVRERFGGDVALQIVDRRIFHEPKELEGWQYLSLLRSEGSYEHIKQRLHQALEHQRSAGRISEDAYGQALGYAPGPKHQGMDSSPGGRNEDPRYERSGTPENRQENFLAVTPSASEPNPSSPGTHEPTAYQLRSEELRRLQREKWATQYGPDSQARKDAKDLKSEQHVDRGEGKNP